MKVVIKVSKDQIQTASDVWKEKHSSYYGQPHGWRQIEDSVLEELFRVPESEVLHLGLNTSSNLAIHNLFGWVTSGGNAVCVDPERGTATYLGTRNGISPLYDLSVDRSTNQEVEACKILSYESTMPFLKPFETLKRFFERASLGADCEIERGIAALKNGKTAAFLYGNFSGPEARKIIALYKECENHGYCVGL